MMYDAEETNAKAATQLARVLQVKGRACKANEARCKDCEREADSAKQEAYIPKVEDSDAD